MLDQVPSPTRSLLDLAREERALTFAHFTCEHAWVIGNILRNALRNAETPALIHIALASSQILFHSPSMPGMMPDTEHWVARKTATVLRWGHSTWYMNCRFSGDEKNFGDFFGLGTEERRAFTLDGGGYPVFVKGVEGVVGTIVVVGLEGDIAHGVVIKAVEEYRELREGFKTTGGR